MVEIKNGIYIQKKDLLDTIKCTKKVIEHIRKKQEECMPRGKVQDFEKPSDYEKCVRSTFVKMGLFTFCSLGLGKPICETYDIAKEEEKRLGRRLTDNEIYQIVTNVAKRYSLISEGLISDYKEDILKVSERIPDSEGGHIVKQCS